MDLFTKIIDIYSEINENDFIDNGKIRLQDDGDGIQYIAKWEYSKPLPEGMKVGKN